MPSPRALPPSPASFENRLRRLPPARVDEPLGEAIDRLLRPWLARTGLLEAGPHNAADYQLGRFAMLCYPDAADHDRLLLAAQNFAAQFAADDYYSTDQGAGADAALVGARMPLAMLALDPANLSGKLAEEFDRAIHADPVLLALRSYAEHLSALATPAQLGRVRHECVNMFLTWPAEASWQLTGRRPPLWSFAAQRQFNGALACTALIDVVGGYELSAELYYAPQVRQLCMLASELIMLVNELYSMGKESSDPLSACNLPAMLRTELGCSAQEAVERCVDMYNAGLQRYEQAERMALRHAPPALERYLAGLRAWIGGSHEWHRHSGRYQPPARTAA